MIIETITNFNAMPLITFAQNVLMILGGFTLLIIAFFLIYSHKNINVFINQNNKLIEKYPLVSEIFMKQPLRQQNIENNQEIHEINEKFDALEKMVKDLQNANRT